MQLPGLWFERIVATWDAPAQPAEGAAPERSGETVETITADQRRQPRVGLRARVTLIPLTDGDGLAPGPLAVPVRDISAGGIGFLHHDKVPLDTQFVALLPHGDESVAVLCQVAYYQPLADRVFAVGARFVRVLRRPAGEDAGATLPLPAGRVGENRRAAS